MAEKNHFLKISAVHLNVSHLERASFFFTEAIGLKIFTSEPQSLALGPENGHIMIVLHQVNNPPPLKATTGLFHLALLLPGREDLARLILYLVNNNVSIQGVADHGVSESIYLTGPDGIGIEIYSDRAKEEWPLDEEGHLEMGTDELDLDNLLMTVQGKNKQWRSLPADTRIGHIHLKAAELKNTARFFNALGLKLTQKYGEQALFFASENYHHQIAVNTWESAGADPLPVDTAGLRSFQITLNDQSMLDDIKKSLTLNEFPFEDYENNIQLHDPNGILIELVTLPATP